MGGSTYSNLFPLEGIYSKLIFLPVYHTSCSTVISGLINALYAIIISQTKCVLLVLQ